MDKNEKIAFLGIGAFIIVFASLVTAGFITDWRAENTKRIHQGAALEQICENLVMEAE